MNAAETLHDVTKNYCFMPEHIWLKWLREVKPGQTYQNLPDDVKEKLKELKSDDLRNLRPDLISDLVAWCDDKAKWAKGYIQRHDK